MSTIESQIEEIIPGLFIGNSKSAENDQLLSNLKVSHILRLNTRARVTYPDSYKYLLLPLPDTPLCSLFQFFDKAFTFIDDGLGISDISIIDSESNSSKYITLDHICKESKGGVLVSCYRGMSRSASLIIGYLMYRCHISFQDAFSIINQRKMIYPNLGFRVQLQKFEKQLNSLRRNKITFECDKNWQPIKKPVKTVLRKNLITAHIYPSEEISKVLELTGNNCSEEWITNEMINYLQNSFKELNEMATKAMNFPLRSQNRGVWMDYGYLYNMLLSYKVLLPDESLQSSAKETITILDNIKKLFSHELDVVKYSVIVNYELKNWIDSHSKETTKEPSKESIKESIKDSIKEPIKEQIEKPFKKSISQYILKKDKKLKK